jgi:hypothetical protein
MDCKRFTLVSCEVKGENSKDAIQRGMQKLRGGTGTGYV